MRGWGLQVGREACESPGACTPPRSGWETGVGDLKRPRKDLPSLFCGQEQRRDRGPGQGSWSGVQEGHRQSEPGWTVLKMGARRKGKIWPESWVVGMNQIRNGGLRMLSIARAGKTSAASTHLAGRLDDGK